MPSDWVTLAVAGAGILGTVVSPIVAGWLAAKREAVRDQQELVRLDRSHAQNIAQLKEAHAQELERIEKQLAHEFKRLETTHVLALEQQRAGALNERRAEIIGKVYELLVTAETRMADLVRVAESAGDRERRDERAKSAADAANAFQEYSFAHRIYLDPDTAEALEKVRTHLVEVWVDYNTGQQLPELWVKAWKAHREEFPRLRKQLEEQFRAALGVVPTQLGG